MRKIEIDARQVVEWYNVLAQMLRDAQIPANPHTMQAMGLLYASQLRAWDFELSEAVRAFKNMWSLDAALQTVGPPESTPGVAELKLSGEAPQQEPEQPKPIEPVSEATDGTLEQEREKLRAEIKAKLN